MKRFPLLPLLALVFAAAYACTDSTAPANSHRLLSPKEPATFFRGDPPPPPVDAAMTITVSSPGSALFTGVYFSNGSSIGSQFAATEVADNGISNGTAWLRLDNKKLDPNGTSSANARFKNQDGNLSATGTLTFKELNPDGFLVDVVYKITFGEGDYFTPSDNCGVPGDICADIKFTAIDKFGNLHVGRLIARNVEGCILTDNDGLRFICPPPPPPPEG